MQPHVDQAIAQMPCSWSIAEALASPTNADIASEDITNRSHDDSRPKMGLIRQGREDGWLRLPPEALRPWALLNGVDFTHVKPDIIAGRGAGLVATKACTNNAEGEQRLMTVPRDLILSVERVAEQAKVDKDYREVLESLGDVGRVGNFLHDFSIHLLGWRLAAQQASLPSTSLSLLSLNAPFFTELPAHRLTAGQTPRAAILSFLLVQCATASPALPTKIGVHSAFTE